MTTDIKRRVTVFINAKIAKHAKAQALIEELNLSSFVEKSLISYLPKETVIRKAKINE